MLSFSYITFPRNHLAIQGFGEAEEFTWVRKAILNHALGEAEVMSGNPPLCLTVLACADSQSLSRIAETAISVGWE